MNRSEYRTYVTILGWINIAFSLVLLSLGLFGFLFLGGIGAASGDPEAMRILGFVGFFAAIFFVTLSVPGFAAGYGLLARKAWGRIVAILVAVLDLFNIPIGTAIGIYALWVLTDERASEYFS